MADPDKGGATWWTRVQEAYSRAEAIVREWPPAGAKEWNDALRAIQGRAPVLDRGDACTPSRDRRELAREKDDQPTNDASALRPGHLTVTMTACRTLSMYG